MLTRSWPSGVPIPRVYPSKAEVVKADAAQPLRYGAFCGGVRTGTAAGDGRDERRLRAVVMPALLAQAADVSVQVWGIADFETMPIGATSRVIAPDAGV